MACKVLSIIIHCIIQRIIAVNCFPFYSYGHSWKCQGSAVIYVWGSKHVQLIPLPFNRLTNRIPCITNDDLRHPVENHLELLLVMERLWQLVNCNSCTYLESQACTTDPAAFNWFANHIPFITNDILRWFSMIPLRPLLVLNGIWFGSRLNCGGISCTCVGFQICATILIDFPAIYLS